jgi:glycerophosphoryl diester phosphodiesterase
MRTMHQIIAHRGASAYAPENTLISMRKAHAMGAKWVEFDVMIAGCGTPIIMHDDNLARTAGLNRLVVDTPWSEISELDAGSWFSPAYLGEKVPTFEELLACLNELSLSINVEIKSPRDKSRETVERVLEVLTSNWPCDENPPLISSAEIDCLLAVKKAAPEMALGCVLDTLEEDWREWMRNLGCLAMSVNRKILDANTVQQMKEVVPLVLAYTVNDPVKANELFQWGVDAVFTDYPDLLAKE